MKKHLQEKISELMDGESNDYTCFDDEESKATWRRYHIISDIMHHRTPVNHDIFLSEKISESIKNDPTIFIPKNKFTFNYFRPIAGVALAASVAVIAIFGIQQHQAINFQQEIQTAQVQQTQEQAIGFDSNESVQSNQINIETDPRLSRYILNHNEYQSRIRPQGVVPVSIFIERLSNEELVNSSSMNMNGINIYTRGSNGLQVTAVGEVSDPTVRQIVESVISTR